jgi:uncharacterized protein YndB with AHSA1/START domain
MSVEHDRFTLERRIAAKPEHAFRTWSDTALKRQWFVDNDGPGWSLVDYALDFRAFGRETGIWRATAPGQPWDGEHRNETVYLSILPNRRIVYSYTMALNGVVHSASLSTVEFAAADAGATRLRYTEQIAMIDTTYGVQGRVEGWEKLFAALDAMLANARPAA